MLTGPGDTEWEGCIQALLNVPQAIDRFREIRYWPLIDASWVYSAREAELLNHLVRLSKAKCQIPCPNHISSTE